MGAVHEDVQLRGDARLQERLIKVDGRCRRNCLVGEGLIDECRRGVFGDKQNWIVFGAEGVALVEFVPRLAARLVAGIVAEKVEFLAVAQERSVAGNCVTSQGYPRTR